ncbi:hypothetical protein H5410_049096 [Solanum commersonii]|uniref:Uncharacterized protein n=1 Tax=Solanum commersonii TaxID=4109 RepID=A0A9J5XNR2_SOLCO|nr:hypothetical protein H5410_049096 [Solanum commersonii]
MHIYTHERISRGANLSNLISLTLVKLCNPQGVILGWTVTCGSLFVWSTHIDSNHPLCILMLLMPVTIDMEIMYALCALSIGVSTGCFIVVNNDVAVIIVEGVLVADGGVGKEVVASVGKEDAIGARKKDALLLVLGKKLLRVDETNYCGLIGR